jgi:hypothetical protein
MTVVMTTNNVTMKGRQPGMIFLDSDLQAKTFAFSYKPFS